jgi:hypothetical protein
VPAFFWRMQSKPITLNEKRPRALAAGYRGDLARAAVMSACTCAAVPVAGSRLGGTSLRFWAQGAAPDLAVELGVA